MISWRNDMIERVALNADLARGKMPCAGGGLAMAPWSLWVSDATANAVQLEASWSMTPRDRISRYGTDARSRGRLRYARPLGGKTDAVRGHRTQSVVCSFSLCRRVSCVSTVEPHRMAETTEPYTQVRQLISHLGER